MQEVCASVVLIVFSSRLVAGEMTCDVVDDRILRPWCHVIYRPYGLAIVLFAVIQTRHSCTAPSASLSLAHIHMKSAVTFHLLELLRPLNSLV